MTTTTVPTTTVPTTTVPTTTVPTTATIPTTGRRSTVPTATDLVTARLRNQQVWSESSRLLYAGRIEEFLRYWAPDARYEVAYPVAGMPSVVQGHEQLRAMFGGFGAAAAAIDVHDVVFHQTDDPQVAIVQERMVAELHGGGRYENLLIIVVTFHDGQIVRMLEYYGQLAHENLLRQLGFVN
jgi:ketosteroid isomerase-like protein